MTITLYEELDIERLNQVLNCDNIPFDETSDEIDWFNRIPKVLLMYSKMKRTSRGVKITYDQINKHGRHYTTIGAQFFQRDIRKYIMRYKDFDISNCHPVIVEWLFTHYGITDRFLLQYNLNRQDMIDKHCLKDKLTVIKCINNERQPKNKSLVEFHKHIQELIDILLKDPVNKNLLKQITTQKRKKDKSANNFRGSFISHYLHDIENEMLMLMMEYCKGQNIPVTILMFDGLGIDPSFDLSENQLREMEKLIESRMSISVKICEKSTETNWVPNVIDKVTLEEPTTYVTEFKCDELDRLYQLCFVSETDTKPSFNKELFSSLVIPFLNKFLVRFQKPNSLYGWRECIDDDFQMISKRPDIISDVIWSRWLLNDCKINYHHSSFIVDETHQDLSKNIFNKYTRPTSTHDPNILENCNLFFDYLLRILSDNDTKLYNYLLKWIATMVQKGQTKQIIVLIGEMGCGKSSAADILKFIVGTDYFVLINSIERLTARFNTHFEKAILTSCEEVSSNAGEYFKVQNILKTLSTDPEIFIEGKGTNGYFIESQNNFILITNGDNPFHITEGNRRGCIIQPSYAELGNAHYFITMKQQVVKNIEGLRQYFRDLPIPNNLNDFRPTTEKELDLLELNKASSDLFIEQLDTTEPRRLIEVYSEYKTFSYSKGMKNTIDERYFKCRLKAHCWEITKDDNNEDIIKYNELNLQNITKTGKGQYQVSKMYKGNRFKETFETLQEAIKYRNSIGVKG